jgi:hypothetical protein
LADRLQAQILDAERITWRRSNVHDGAEESRQLTEMRVYSGFYPRRSSGCERPRWGRAACTDAAHRTALLITRWINGS